MFHGGTNFGFYNGANGLPYAPDTTSYDYDALLTEDGRLTPKFHWMRTLLRRHLEVQEGTDEPQYNEPQAANHGIMYDSVRPSAAVSLFDVVQQLSREQWKQKLTLSTSKRKKTFFSPCKQLFAAIDYCGWRTPRWLRALDTFCTAFDWLHTPRHSPSLCKVGRETARVSDGLVHIRAKL